MTTYFSEIKEMAEQQAVIDRNTEAIKEMPSLQSGPTEMVRLLTTDGQFLKEDGTTRWGYSSGDLFTKEQAEFLKQSLGVTLHEEVMAGIVEEFCVCRQRNHGAEREVYGGHFLAMETSYEEKIGSAICFSGFETRFVPYGEEVTETFYSGFPSGITEKKKFRAVEGNEKLVIVEE